MSKGWIGVDFDGTLHVYHGMTEELGPPVLPMVQRVKGWLAQGIEVRIFTARACFPEDIPFIQDWCEKHIGVRLAVTNVKDYSMVELWDDRAIQVHENQGHPVAGHIRRIKM